MTGGRRSVEDHARHVATLLSPLLIRGTEPVPLLEALGRVLAEDVVAPIDLPTFRNSQMDGYAVDTASLTAVPATLPVRAVLAAGDGVVEHVPGTATKIMTGAPLPTGADAVVPVEDTAVPAEDTAVPAEDTAVPAEGRRHRVTVQTLPEPGAYVRERGSDIRGGRTLLPAGAVVAARHVAALAAVGLTHVSVRTRPRVAVISTGSELVPGGSVLAPGKIHDSNGPALAASAAANGALVISVDRSGDDAEVFAAKLAHAASVAEVVFTSGGVSKGDFEVVKDVLGPRGAEFVSVAMQPGGPQGTALVDSVPVLTFPGNPVSALVSFEVFARAVLRAAAGLPAVEPETRPLSTRLSSVPGKRQFLRGRRDGGAVVAIPGAGSHLIAAMATADVLLDIPADTTDLETGELVKVLPL
ncbi:molybdopterin molybdotransferase MoeA [Rhodococcus sp. 14C212]|uniref:molybdopterin molybdotransferase MoeA n=1 Tax=Rhodococcus sp. 14C212 TaxID=2711209 RepID=UPI0013ED5EEE|nr:gephyrin-like molybdotransferase Glp [Rhodococcus sp. 14C212]NGP04082.1 molybdopterin molybdotransferase MoeA [Rhodococcus sp. 14C212]